MLLCSILVVFIFSTLINQQVVIQRAGIRQYTPTALIFALHLFRGKSESLFSCYIRKQCKRESVKSDKCFLYNPVALKLWVIRHWQFRTMQRMMLWIEEEQNLRIKLNINAFLQTLEYSFFMQSLSAMKKITNIVFKICHFCVTTRRNEKKKCKMGYESDKLIESYSAQRSMTTIEQQFESSSIVRWFYNSSKFRSVQPVLTAGPH